MKLRHSSLIATLSALVLTASAAGAAVLWDQSNWATNLEGSVNLSSNSCSQISGNTKAHTASDVHFDQPVHITTVRIYETTGNVQAATQAYLWITPKTGPLPTALSTDLEQAALLVPITSTTVTVNNVTAVQVTAANLNKDLAAGDYWVSLTPRHSLGIFPYTVHLVTGGPIVGDPTAVVVACNANTNWTMPLAPNVYDYSLKIEGDLPVVPTNATSWGALKLLYR